MTIFFKYGRYFYTTRKEAEDVRINNECIYFDKGLNAYYIIKKKTFWEF